MLGDVFTPRSSWTREINGLTDWVGAYGSAHIIASDRYHSETGCSVSALDSEGGWGVDGKGVHGGRVSESLLSRICLLSALFCDDGLGKVCFTLWSEGILRICLSRDCM